MRDYPCSINNRMSMAELTRDKSLKESARKKTLLYEAESIAELALLTKETTGEKFCKLPFDHILEAESLGSSSYFDAEKIELRVGKAPYNTIEDLLQMKTIDFQNGRIHQVLKATEILNQNGETVLLNVSGPFTILNGLIPTEYIFRGWKKEPELMDRICLKLSKEILRFIQVAQEHGVTYFSYADPLGGVSILGPKLMEEVTMRYTAPLIYEINGLLKEGEMLILCPKTSLALIDTRNAKIREWELSHPMSYQEGILEMSGKCKIVGMHCINMPLGKNISDSLQEIIFTGSVK